MKFFCTIIFFLQKRRNQQIQAPLPANREKKKKKMNTTTNRAILNQQHVDTFLSQCGLSEYFETFIEEGFDRPESVR